jgi:hypothetical protein
MVGESKGLWRSFTRLRKKQLWSRQNDRMFVSQVVTWYSDEPAG